MKVKEAITYIDDVLSSDYHYDETLGYQLTSDDIEWLEMAKKALEKQVPKKPIKLVSELLIREGWTYKCPTCLSVCGENKYHLEVTQDEFYCTQCGQALDWE